MLFPPLTIQDLASLFAVSAILLLFTTELVPYAFGERTLVSDMKKLRSLSLVLGALFLVTIVIIYWQTITNAYL